jgi:hypothetical protein
MHSLRDDEAVLDFACLSQRIEPEMSSEITMSTPLDDTW